MTRGQVSGRPRAGGQVYVWTLRGCQVCVPAVWLVHGLYNKLLGGSPRHLAIVQAVPGLEGAAGVRMLAIVGLGEVAIAVWMLSRRAPRWCAAVQTVALLSMNVVELTYARPLLLWPAGLLPLNLAFLALVWACALQKKGTVPFFRNCARG